MEDVLAAEDRVADETAEKVLEEPLALCDDGRILLGLGLALDCIVGEILL